MADPLASWSGVEGARYLRDSHGRIVRGRRGVPIAASRVRALAVLAGLAVIVVCLVALGLAGNILLNYLSSDTPTTGVVRSISSGRHCSETIEYVVDGVRYSTNKDGCPDNEGDEVALKYDKADPATASADSPGELVWTVGLLTAAGIGVGVAGLGPSLRRFRAAARSLRWTAADDVAAQGLPVEVWEAPHATDVPIRVSVNRMGYGGPKAELSIASGVITISDEAGAVARIDPATLKRASYNARNRRLITFVDASGVRTRLKVKDDLAMEEIRFLLREQALEGFWA